MKKGSTRLAQDWGVAGMQGVQRAIDLKRAQHAKEIGCMPAEVLDEILFPVQIPLIPCVRGKATRQLQEVNLAKKQETASRAAQGLKPFEGWVLRAIPLLDGGPEELFRFEATRPTGRVSRRGHMFEEMVGLLQRVEEAAEKKVAFEDTLNEFMGKD